MAQVIFEPGDVVWINNKIPSLILPENHILIIVKENRAIMYAKRIEIKDQEISLMNEEQIKSLDYEIKLAFEAALEVLQIQNLNLNVSQTN